MMFWRSTGKLLQGSPLVSVLAEGAALLTLAEGAALLTHLI